MITYISGNIFDADVEAIVNTVNCVGVMGRGIALQFKKQFPENFALYTAACKKKEVQTGKMFIYETCDIIGVKYIINFPTKRHWKNSSRIEDIIAGLDDLVQFIKKENIMSIAIPPLGCGLGGLDWNCVQYHIEEKLKNLENVKILVYLPQGAPAPEKMISKLNKPNMTPGRAALIWLIHHYLNAMLDPFISLLEVHKLLYFLQITGENLRLKFEQAPYGPYAENLRHVLNAMEGHYISGYGDGGDNPHKQLTLMENSTELAKDFLKEQQDTVTNINKVQSLVEGFESEFGLELLATVHWVITNNSLDSIDDIITYTYQWNEHKKQFSPRQIKLATSRLVQQKWVASIKGI